MALNQETRVRMRVDDVASNICQGLRRRPTRMATYYTINRAEVGWCSLTPA